MEPILAQLDPLRMKLLTLCDSRDVLPVAWQMVCGDHVRAKTSVTSFVDGRLTVTVIDADWLPALSRLSREYIVSLNKLSPLKVAQIIFEVGRKKL